MAPMRPSRLEGLGSQGRALDLALASRLVAARPYVIKRLQMFDMSYKTKYRKGDLTR